MQSTKNSIKQMDKLLDELIEVARQLRDASLQVISEEQLIPLQQQQEEILSQLEQLDQNLPKGSDSEISASMHQHFHQKLKEFKNLNQEFVANLGASHGLIQFELRRFKEE